ncbi:hypothetical protein VNO78_25877 [Psophocarpus tetragonolobus]|uniref:NB-ARC domain-containing protein n=1 Tax=Psophocarpus tetragonolobus TaxID=3891 RepID=A0AAN9XFD1_PSOTE
MANIAADLAKPILEKLMDATIRQSRYICCYTAIEEEFEKEKETLKAKGLTMADYVKVAKRRCEVIRSDVTLWQEQVERLIQEDNKTKVTCFFGCCPNCKWKYSRGKELVNKTEEMKRLIKSNFESFGIHLGVADVDYYSSEDYISFESRKLKYQELLDALTDDNIYMTGLQGMGGTGKTTLAKEIGKELKKTQRFDYVIFTIVSSTPDLEKIQDDIVGPLGLTLQGCTERERPKRLWSRLTNGEKILIILDDLWEDINFEDIGIPKKDNRNGCRILVTTRNIRICNSMGCDRKIQLELLPEEDAWKLFKNHAGLSDSSPKIILDKGQQITNECKGLPMAIAIIASSLKGEQRLEEWSLALNTLQNYIPEHGDDEIMGKIFKCLRYSFDNMKNKIGKELFLLCSMFREDEEIFDNILTRVSIGAGLVDKIDNNNDSYDACRSEVVVAKNKLIDSCLLLKTGETWIKMHDMVREVALWIANKEIQAVNICNKNQKLLVEKAKNLKYLQCEGKVMDVFSLRFDGSKLKILIFYLDDDFDERENDLVVVPNSFFKNMIELRVLYFSIKTYQKTTLSSPKSIQSLTNIRSLILVRFVLGDMSILQNLHCLETLDLVHCLMDQFPPDIAKLQKLKLLHMHFCIIESNNPFEVIESCSSLQELYFICDFPRTYKKVELPKLERFRIVDTRIPFYFRAAQSVMNSLYVSKIDDFFCRSTFKHLVQKTENLHLFELQEIWRSFIPAVVEPRDQATGNLYELRLTRISQLHYLINTKHIGSQVQYGFSKLVVLVLKEMENLKKLFTGPLPFELLKSLEKLSILNCLNLQGKLFMSNITLCNLKSLGLFSCPMLVSVFQLSTAQSLLLLEDLSIDNCEKLKSIITYERKRQNLGEEIVDGDNVDRTGGSLFTSLKTLRITRCPQLDFILPVVTSQDVPKLRVVEIRNCIELKYIFEPYQHKHDEQHFIFVALKEMVLETLPNFVDIFPECDESMCSFVKRSSPKVGSNTHKESTSIRCNIFSWLKSTKVPLDSKDRYQHQSLSSVHASSVIEQELNVDLMKIQLIGPEIFFTLQNISELTIGKCKKVKVIFSTAKLECLPQLHTLSIFECNELKHVIDEDIRNQRLSFFPRLKVLVITECKNLQCVFPMSTGKMVPELELLVIKEASKLEEVFGCESDQKVEIPNLKIVKFITLPNLCKGIGFETVNDCLVENCPKLSLTSTSSIRGRTRIGVSDVTKKFIQHTLQYMLGGHYKCSNRNQNSTSEGMEDFPTESNIKAASRNELSSLQVNTNESIEANVEEYNQHGNNTESNEFISGETQSKETSEEEKEPDEKPSTTISPTDSKLIRRPAQSPSSDILVHKTHSFEIKQNIEEGTTSASENTVTLPIGSGSVTSILCPIEDCEEQIAIPFSMVNAELATTKDIGHAGFQETYNFVVTHSNTNASGSNVSNKHIKDTLQSLLNDICESSKAQEITIQNSTAEATKDFPTETKVQVALGSKLASSQVNTNQSIHANIAEYNQAENGIQLNEFICADSKTKETLESEHENVGSYPSFEKPSIAILPTDSELMKRLACQIPSYVPLYKAHSPIRCLKDIQDQSAEEGSISGNTPITTLSTKKMRKISWGPLVTSLQKEIKKSIEEGSTSTYGKTLAIPIVSESDSSLIGPLVTSRSKIDQQENGEGVISIPSFSVEDGASIKDVGDGDFRKTSKFVVTHSLSNTQGNLSQITEDSSVTLIVKREIEQLVSNKHLALENLSLLTNFLVKHPSVHLSDNTLSDRYKGFAYTCLAEFLKFLQTHSVLDVLGSSRSKFVELLQDVRSCGFNKDWLDDVERRALFHEDPLQKILDSKNALIQQLEDIKHGMIQHLEHVKHHLEEQEAQVLKFTATFNTPLGY